MLSSYEDKSMDCSSQRYRKNRFHHSWQ